ncbi:hypothetical protein AXK12_05270 [Cephaloticoccus capnophilus]|uniref:Alpha-galactosidase n=1 Tax=Cephaloticoccus capnophilus TaxID=1548208 RepID=A0A139SLG3_9BACT|nr:hypothetical protein AXK12_05270 [Cephaloticoccus capnophilus]
MDFYGNNGSHESIHDFEDRIELDIDEIELIPHGGRSSDGIFPFFALTDQHDAFAIGIGWSGRWCAKLRHAAGALQVEVGLPQVGFVLRPQESVRLPSVLLARAPGASADQARRVVRSHLTHHVRPKAPDGKSPLFTSHGTMYRFHVTRIANEQGEIEALERAAAMGIEAYWVDACWYGNLPDWAKEVGNWYARRSDFPRGLRPISDRAHELGMKFIFWMEPERVRPDTEWARTYPDLLLHYPNDDKRHPWYRGDMLLNLGDPRAVDLAFETVSSLITEFNTDIYRQDFSGYPLDAWYAADAPDRVGITEIRHIEGLYALWDRIRAAHPGILIDNCAGGGRRIDLETLRRATVLTRSDIVDVDDEGGKAGDKVNIVNQIQCWGLGQWLADHAGLNNAFDAYATRSALCTGFMAYRDLPENEQDPEYADLIATLAELKRLRPFMDEERIGLIAPDLDKEALAAFQHHRHSDASGIIVALRGPEANADSVTLHPEYIDVGGTYQVTKWNDYRQLPATRISGAALKELAMTIAQRRSSVLVEYHRVSG